MRTFLLFAPAVACALTLTAAGVSAKPGLAGGQVVFASSGHITFADVSDGRELRVAEPGDAVVDVSVSPDGRWFAYETSARQGFSLYVADRSGRNRRPLATYTEYITEPVWSPDGTQLAYTDAAGGVWIARVNRRRRQRISSFDLGTYAWSPDGKTFAYCTEQGLILAEAKMHTRRVLLPKAAAEDMAWTPDGRSIVYVDDSDRVLSDVNVVGKTHRRRVVADRVSYFELSPDGRTVAYKTADGELYTVPLAGGRRRRIASSFFEYAWSPDSTRLAFSRPLRHGVASAIYLVPGRGGVPRRLLTSIGGDGARWPSWSPDGGRLAYQNTKDGRAYVVDADGSHNRPIAPDDPEALPEARPIGWLPRPVALPAPSPATTLAPAERAAANAAVAGLAVDGDQALAISGSCCDAEGLGSWQATLWAPGSSTTSSGSLCPQYLSSFAVAGSRFAYTCEDYDADPPEQDVYTATVQQPNQVQNPVTSSDGEVSVAGRGQLLVATANNQLLRLNPDGTSTLLRAYPEGSFPFALAVDENRVLVESAAVSGKSDLLEVVSGDGVVAARLPDPPHDGAALLRANQVFTVRDDVLAVRDLSGQVQSTRRLTRDAQLEDVSGGLVMYSAASRLHLLRLSDGKDITLRIPGQLLHAWARFADDGSVFYAYNTFAPQRYWTAYVPAGTINALLG